MVVAGFEVIENVLNHSFFIDHEADAMDTIILPAHKRLGSPYAKSLSNLMVFISQQGEIKFITRFEFFQSGRGVGADT